MILVVIISHFKCAKMPQIADGRALIVQHVLHNLKRLLVIFIMDVFLLIVNASMTLAVQTLVYHLVVAKQTADGQATIVVIAHLFLAMLHVMLRLDVTLMVHVKMILVVNILICNLAFLKMVVGGP
jgi:hypothetical protein